NKQLVMESLVKVRQIELPSDTENPGSFKCFMNRYKMAVTVKNGNKDQLDSGLFWVNAPDSGGANQLGPLCRSLEFESLFCQMHPGDGMPLTAEEARILLAVPVHKRYDFCLSNSFQLAQRFQVGSIVSVLDPSFVEKQEATNSLKCEVRFKGVLPSWTNPKDPDGLYFGFVSCDPKVDGQPLIISVLPDDNTRQLLNVRAEARDRRLILADARWLDPVQDCPADQLFNINDRVVLQLDARQNEYRRGLIKWLGRLDANGPKHLAGVEFDHQVPNSSCWLDNRLLFEGKPECCLIVEEAHLQREKDFDRKLAESRANAGRIYQPPAQPPNSSDPRRDEAQALMESRGIRIDSHVNLTFLDKVGMVMWFGFIPNQTDLVVGVALDDNEGVERGGHGFVPSSQVRAVHPDVQPYLWFTFLDAIEPAQNANNQADRPRGAEALPHQFGSGDFETIAGPTEPRIRLDGLDNLVGRNRGVQGHHNSCYLDSTLFAMFATVGAFDGVLERPGQAKDIDNYEEIKNTLREGIVNCLRRNKFVSARQVLKLRKCLNDLDIIPGMMGEEKDPEEFINLLLDHALRHEPFIKLSTGQSSHVLQLFLDRADLPFEQQKQQQQQQQQPQSTGAREHIADTETLLHLSLIQSNIQFSEPPQCLILQMPRSGKSYKMFHRILPVLQLNITNLLPDTARACNICGNFATIECHQCFLKHDSGRDYTYCEPCYKMFADHRKGKTHEPIKIKYPRHILEQYQNRGQVVESQTVMDLLAVVCICTSHYVCFLRAEPNHWLFFDSMADREGGCNDDYNIPEVTRVDGLEEWLRDLQGKTGNAPPPEQGNRLLEDCYLCFYGNPRSVPFPSSS
ncbi:hypothetical protein BOX15_Mlig027790g3, partial [Macrostomum lignano]